MARRHEFGEGEAGCPDRCAGKVGYRENGLQVALTLDVDALRPVRRASKRGPDCGEGLLCRVVHSVSEHTQKAELRPRLRQNVVL